MLKFIDEFTSVIMICIAILAAVAIESCPRTAHASPPEEPPLSALHKWYPAGDGTVILEYRVINKHAIQLWRFKHAQTGVAGKFPSCNEVTVRGDELRLITQEPKPSLYFIEKRSNGFSPEFHLDFTYERW